MKLEKAREVLGSGFREQKRDLGDPAFPPQGRLKGEGIKA
jgi:hypothetical protein